MTICVNTVLVLLHCIGTSFLLSDSIFGSLHMYEYLPIYHNSKVKNLDIYVVMYIGSNAVRSTSMENIGKA